MKRNRLVWLAVSLAMAINLTGAAIASPGGAVPPAPPVEINAEVQYARAGDSVFYVRSYYASGSLKATGSGFVLSPDGLAVTAAHVIDKGARIAFVRADGTELDCTVVSCDAATDVAVLRLPAGTYPALTLAGEAPKGGAAVRAMGYPIKDTLMITEGIVSAPAGTVSGKNRMLVTCDIVNGMSGGPIFDRFGQVVGVCSGSVRTMNGIHLSVLHSDLTAAVNAALNNGKGAA